MKENIFLCKYFMKFYETKNLYIDDIILILQNFMILNLVTPTFYERKQSPKIIYPMDLKWLRVQSRMHWPI